MSMLSSPENLPTNSELLELIKKQDDVIEQLTKQLESATTSSSHKFESESSDNEISEALSINRNLLIEMKNKLKESVNIMEHLNEKNESLSTENRHLKDARTGYSPGSQSLFEMHNLLDNERAEGRRIHEELFSLKKSEQKKDKIIAELEGELERSRKLTNSLNAEMKTQIEQLLKEVGEKSEARERAKMEKKDAEDRLLVVEESSKLKEGLLEEHCKKLQSEVATLTKKKLFLNERIRNLTEEMGILRQKLFDADFDYFGDDEIQAFIREQKAVIESTRAENLTLKTEIKKMKSIKNYQQKHKKERRRAVDELIDKYLLKL